MCVCVCVFVCVCVCARAYTCVYVSECVLGGVVVEWGEQDVREQQRRCFTKPYVNTTTVIPHEDWQGTHPLSLFR